MNYYRRDRQPGALWELISVKMLREKLTGNYTDIDAAIEAMNNSPGKPIVTTGFADYKANAIQLKVTWNACKGEYIFTCPECSAEWNDDDYPDIKARIKRRGNCPNCEDRKESSDR